ncbi:hypothetical protein ACKKBF_B09895 [Auxenochlorella protothecoides x Auxenochlorella symbiontica]
MQAIRTFVVTGANRAIELEWVRQLLVRPGNRVLAGVSGQNESQDVQKMVPGIEVLPLEAGDAGSLNAWADEVAKKTPHIDVLIHNAGVATSLPNIRLNTSDFTVGDLSSGSESTMPIVQALHSRSLLGGMAGRTLLARVCSQDVA